VPAFLFSASMESRHSGTKRLMRMVYPLLSTQKAESHYL